MSCNHNCYNCKHLGPQVPGSVHRTCIAITSNALEQLLLATTTLVIKQTGQPAVKQNEHGVRNGWCIWPINFDPIWIDDCIFYEEKELKNG